MDAVFRRVSSLWTDGSRLAGGLLAVGLWVRSLGLDCVAVAALVAWFAGCSVCRGAVRGAAPESPCPWLTVVGLLIGSAVNAASYAGNDACELRR